MERMHKVVLFIDIVESVRLVEEDEEDTISRWLSFVQQVTSLVATSFNGRVIKQTGDGLIIEFAVTTDAVRAAFAIQQQRADADALVPMARRLLLRMGLSSAPVLVDHDDVFGRGVNAAARLMTLAGPGEIVVSASARESLVASLDADIEDLGECYLRHVSQPVHAFKITPPGSAPVVTSPRLQGHARPTLAVIPFDVHGTEDNAVVGDIISDDITHSLSRTHELNVISSLSTSALRGRRHNLADIASSLGLDYILTGMCRISGPVIVLNVEFIEINKNTIIWSERLNDSVGGVMSGDSQLISRIVSEVSRAIMSYELQKARTSPLPTLKNYTLLFGAIALMHRLTIRDFNDARVMLQMVVDRGYHNPIPHAWLAKWHVLRVAQGWSDDIAQDGHLALDHTRKALDSDPELTLALAMQGFVQTNIFRNFDAAQQCYDQAIDLDPNNALGLLLRGMLYAFTDDGARATRDAELALTLTPLDPHRYFYDSLAASANLTAGRYARAEALALRSLRARRTHTSTWRVLAVAQWQLGRCEEARASVRELLHLDPTLTTSAYLRRTPSADFKIGQTIAEVLEHAGVPR